MQVAQWQTSCKGHSGRPRVSGTVTDYVQVAQWQITCSKWHSGRSRAAQVCKQVFHNWSHARHYRLGEWRNFTRGFVSDFNHGAEKFAPRTSSDVLAAFWKHISCFQACTAYQNFRLVVMLFTNRLTLFTAYTYLPVIAYGRYVYEIEWQCLANFSHKCWRQGQCDNSLNVNFFLSLQTNIGSKSGTTRFCDQVAWRAKETKNLTYIFVQNENCWIVRIWYLVKLTATRSWAVLPRSCFPCNNVFLQKSVFFHIVVFKKCRLLLVKDLFLCFVPARSFCHGYTNEIRGLISDNVYLQNTPQYIQGQVFVAGTFSSKKRSILPAKAASRTLQELRVLHSPVAIGGLWCA